MQLWWKRIKNLYQQKFNGDKKVNYKFISTSKYISFFYKL